MHTIKKVLIALPYLFTLSVTAQNNEAIKAKNDSIFKIVKQEQEQYKSINKCPSCPWQAVNQYFEFVKSGNITKANGLVYYGACKTDCAMPMFKGTYEQITTRTEDVKKSWANTELNDKYLIVYIDKNNCVIYKYVKTSGSLQPVVATKVNGLWKLVALNRQTESDYLNKARATLVISERIYFDKLEEKVDNKNIVTAVYSKSFWSPEEEGPSVIFKTEDGKLLYFSLGEKMFHDKTFLSESSEEEKTNKANVGKKYRIKYKPKDNVQDILGEIEWYQPL